VLDRREDAIAAFQRARVVLTQHGQLTMRAIVDFDEALARSWRRMPRSQELLLAAETQFDQLGMTAWSERVAELRRSNESLPGGRLGPAIQGPAGEGERSDVGVWRDAGARRICASASLAYSIGPRPNPGCRAPSCATSSSATAARDDAPGERRHSLQTEPPAAG
jgi:hypothetical protein